MKGMWGAALGAILLLSACGEGGGGAAGAPPGPSGPPVLHSISVTPATLSLACGSIQELVCMGHYSDGHSAPELALWSSSSPLLHVPDTATLLPSTSVSWQGEGSATVTAKAGDLEVEVPVILQSVSTWTLYGLDDSRKIYAYPVGGGLPVVKYTIPDFGPVWGYTVDATGSTLYYDRDLWVDSGDRAPDGSVIYAVAGTEFHKVNTTTWVDTLIVAVPPMAGGRCFGLDIDREGKLWTVHNGTVLRVDPVTGAMQSMGGDGGGMRIDIAVGPDNGKYTVPLGFADPVFMTKKVDGSPAFEWANDHLLAGNDPANYGWVTAGGMAFNNTGDGFVVNSCSNILVRYRDLDGNGTCTDDSECTLYGEVFPAGQDIFMSGPLGVAVAPDGTILVNCYEMPGMREWFTWLTVPNDEGVWAFKDLNGDGDALDAGEKTLFSAKPMVCENVISGLRIARGW